MLKSSLFSLSLLLLCSETLGAALPAPTEAVGGPSVKPPIKYWHCNENIPNSGGKKKEAALKTLFQGVINTANVAHTQIGQMNPAPANEEPFELRERVQAVYDSWFMPAHRTMVSSMFSHYKDLRETDMTLHVYCHPNKYTKQRVPPEFDTDDELMEWIKADTGEDEGEDSEDPAEAAENAKAVAKRVAVGCSGKKNAATGDSAYKSYAFVVGGTNRMYICPSFWSDLPKDDLPPSTAADSSKEVKDMCKEFDKEIDRKRIGSRYKSFVLMHELSHSVKVTKDTGVRDSEGEGSTWGTTDDPADVDMDIDDGLPDDGIVPENGYGLVSSQSRAIKRFGFRNADSYPWTAFHIWKEVHCPPKKRKLDRDTQLDCSTAKRRSTRGGGGESSTNPVSKVRRAIAQDELDEICSQQCPKGTKEMLKPVYPPSGKGVPKQRVPVCAPLRPCKPNQGYKFVEERDRSGKGWPLVKEICDPNTKPDDDKDKDKDAKQAELEAKKKELEDQKAENEKKAEDRKNAVKEEVKNRNTPGTPENERDKEEKDKKCPKGVAGIVCRAGNAAT